ncbi:hypothetical protein SAM23877_0336 [Streptomyces ambofaciens ATCC 23877]|uniref:Uncharacterized protein n=1 Tax=Streptomyces ambofaciens (strain ATCC 23877 / 3486 / DSM 40053 / JCM 4204 / NBRC 12836 / NRRL B-2516) TaxID=278992 RepID=A3KHV0_STRA7|nr:hypothetical protein [Streptomyces ambofaciens]AKZ53385.1 hypothetical protein SAM23877_0336 [Streptomyces ambofaciens ATCC 23877]CAJ89276.1 conserved hypothetical protein [Streptomyces ambofaciens ATCC 23877]
MGWKEAFGDAMKELEAIRQQLARLDDPTVGLTALHGDLTQSRLKILEQLQAGVTGLREENREVRRRQDRMISDLNETRGELRQLLDLVDVLRPFAPPEGTVDRSGGDRQTPSEETVQPPEPEAGYGSVAGAGAEDQLPVSTYADSQGETMDNAGHRPQPGTSEDQDLTLKDAIAASYQGTGSSAGQRFAVTPQASAGAEDPRVAHGVLLLKAAGVASAELIAHRDTWEWLAALAVDHSHFRTPPSVEDIKEGRVQTVLSGRSLIALLIELWNTRSTATPLQGDWALAMTTYNRIAAQLTGVTGQGETARIVLDDGLPHEAGD